MSYSSNSLLQQAEAAFEQKNYNQAAVFYEQLLEAEPETIAYAWYLGLARLLAGNEAEAQFTWMMALSTAEPDQVEACTDELGQVLQTEATRQAASGDWKTAWVIRQHLREVQPDEIHNLLQLVQLAIWLNGDDGQCLAEWGITELLCSQSFPDLDQELLLATIGIASEQWFDQPLTHDFLEAALLHINDAQAIVTALIPKAVALNNYRTLQQTEQAAYLAEICLRYDPNNLEALRLLAFYYEMTRQYAASVATAKRFRDACQTLDEKMVGNSFLITRMLRTGLHWQEAVKLSEQQGALLQQLIAEYVPHPEHSLILSILTSCCFHAYYLEDAPAKHRRVQNQLAALLQSDIRSHAETKLIPHSKNSSTFRQPRKLKIGYIGHTMRQHSVGWLARWLMQHHDRNQFEIYTYHVHRQDRNDPFTQRWFIDPVTASRHFDQRDCVEMANQIRQDEIDILVELDSITYDQTYGVMALKPAPVQVSWLGFDASSIPAVDYFIADPYVLPEAAQAYYNEKIWRLPATYLAVDGFEIGIPTLRRDALGIPTDAIVYLSAQSGQKRHPETMRLQVRILREVPNSYLLIKGLSDEASLQASFKQIAESEGVNPERIQFLGIDANEPTHRANLGIADIVLDTYPYNGATTTLETLWMGIPIVTRVGQQWAARNSYTMLKNVEVEEGIAWSEAEYLEWGVRLGQDATLRQAVQAKLQKSRQTSPLWNTKAFAREMEAAYQQMWQIYLNSESA